MLLLIMCGDLEVADRGMTPAITLVFGARPSSQRARRPWCAN